MEKELLNEDAVLSINKEATTLKDVAIDLKAIEKNYINFAKSIDEAIKANKREGMGVSGHPSYGWFTQGQFTKLTRQGKDAVLHLMSFGLLKTAKIEGISKFRVVLDPEKRKELLLADIADMKKTIDFYIKTIEKIDENVLTVEKIIANLDGNKTKSPVGIPSETDGEPIKSNPVGSIDVSTLLHNENENGSADKPAGTE